MNLKLNVYLYCSSSSKAYLAEAQGENGRETELEAQVNGALAGCGLYGQGSYGLRLYAPYAYRVPSMKLERVHN